MEKRLLTAQTVTASEFQKNFGRYQAQAQRSPIKVTSHGRDSVVLISAEDYVRLKALNDCVALHLEDLSIELDDALEEMRDIEAAEMNHHGFQ